MATFLVRPPEAEPASLQEAKLFLRVDGDDEDDLIAGLVTTARTHVEREARRAMVSQGWRTVLPGRPSGGRVPLGPAPVIAVTAVTAYDAEGTATAVDAGRYRVDRAGEPAELVLERAVAGAENGIEIDFDCGYGTDGAAVPRPLVQAVLMVAAHWYEHREAATLGAVTAPVARGVEALIAPYRAVRLR
ncbi:phage conserved hypothetical protein, phiE125 gp8 family [Pseudoxanthobacter soli DSM 19599]|uniref:Phage gp6-like head-tail connector protein n=1 Tax=Pseudoxanthobacter soli DSM 19599 TaxID=1123029 RepID=A0A1M7ZMX2_9HYPH|nr:head-tail connector protein [Pseudoxanthobacter soli]SHO66227.1 phage conserved hypothetical protein, phiE125 gp8 family [Pseudoxanthobacter soli DSM 19599]